MAEIRANSILPAHRLPLTLATEDGQQLVGELATPILEEPRATLVCVHPLPTHGGMMDSHLLRKMSWRLPALAGYAVLRFNTRGTRSVAGTSTGAFDAGVSEGLDLSAALDEVAARSLPMPWLVGWSFGTDVILKHPDAGNVHGAVLISPPLHFADDADLDKWAATNRPVVALVPEADDYLQPAEARARFARVPQARIVPGVGAGHLWVGEPAVRFVLDEIVRAVTPELMTNGYGALPSTWTGPMEKWSDL